MLIQRQIEARWAGVCFTADPKSGIEQLGVVEAVRGLGERLVAGRTEPAYARFDRRAGRFLELRAPAGEEPEAFERLAREVLALGERVRAAFGGEPVDLEWAHDGAALWLLQARPVTTPTFPLPERRPLAHPELWFHGNFVETMPGPVPAMAWDALDLMLPVTLLPLGAGPLFKRLEAGFVEVLAGRVCWNLALAQHLGLYNRNFVESMRMIDDRMMRAVEGLMRSGQIVPAGELPAAHKGVLLLSILKVQGFVARHSLRALWQGERALKDFEQAGRDLVAASGSEPAEELDPQEAWRRMRALRAAFLPIMGRQVGVFYALFVPVLWSQLAARWSGRAYVEVAGRLGEDPSGTARMERALRELGRGLRADGHAAPPNLGDLPPERRAAFEAFLAEFGHRGPGEQVLSNPRLRERPDLALELAWHSGGAPEPAAADPAHAAEALIEELARKGLGGGLRAALLRWLLPRARKLARTREDGKHYGWMPFLERLRRLALRHGEGLAARGLLERREDVFLLRMRELDALADGKTDGSELRALAARRAREQARWRRLEFPEVLRSDGGTVAFLGADDGDGMAGVAISAGVFEGPARVARTFEEARALQAGEVLVAVALDPGWTPLFSRAGALVMEVGGVLCHAAVVARELKLPAVAGLHGASRRIRTGQRVRVDGRLGRVAILDGEGPRVQAADSA
ncbi:MAG: PEP-utilizing enzyme [Planctomycetota bacterium]|nr:PEP-utilizing enzyme [Planctomycetota bacterium]